jgi:hypothetical protein
MNNRFCFGSGTTVREQRISKPTSGSGRTPSDLGEGLFLGYRAASAGDGSKGNSEFRSWLVGGDGFTF